MAFKELPPSPRDPRSSAAGAAIPSQSAKPTTPAQPAKATAPSKPTTPAKPATPVGRTLAPAVGEPRLVSLDAFRGFIMLMMASAGFGIAKLVKDGNLADAGIVEGTWKYSFWHGLANQLGHAPWQGGVFWDLIQPAFMFMVGAALPYSYARRAARGDSYLSRFLHTLLRSFVLVLLAVYLSTASDAKQTNFIFVNVLGQIGLGYPLLFLFVNKPRWLQGAAIVLIAVGWWYAFYQHPLPPADFDFASVGLKATDDRADFVPEGVRQHWAYNTNFAAELDRVILNWFPREQPFEFNEGGYTTLNFVPSLITMLLGLIAGEILRKSASHGAKLKALAIAAVVCLVVGLAAGYSVNPIVKRIWTPSWALVSGAAVIAMLMLFYVVIDVGGWKRTAWPLAVVGMNSIVVYMLSQMFKPATARLLQVHLGEPYRKFAEWASERSGSTWNPELFGGPFGPIFQHAAVLFCFWLVCVWLWRQKIFVRI